MEAGAALTGDQCWPPPALGCLDSENSLTLRAFTTESLANLEALEGASEDELSHELSLGSEPWDVPCASAEGSQCKAGTTQQRPLNPHATVVTTSRA